MKWITDTFFYFCGSCQILVKNLIFVSIDIALCVNKTLCIDCNEIFSSLYLV